MRALALLVAALALPAAAQTQETLFPGQSGVELQASLRSAYKPSTVLSSAASKDRLYDTVDRVTVGGQDGVIGLYTGWFVPLDGVPSADPSQDVFNNGVGLNQEHTWPRAEGAECNGGEPPGCDGRAEFDMHHLFPSRVQVNGDRGNLPFAEIVDSQATRWYRDDLSQTTPPSTDLDAWSEILTSGPTSGQAFEPREAVKGDVARALFYFATMYGPTNLSAASLAWFEGQRLTLYDWHVADPITSDDQARSQRVAVFQGGRDNPFVLDSALVRRAWVPEVSVAEAGAPLAGAVELRLVGRHPFRDAARLELRVPRATEARVELLDALGRRLAVLHDGAVAAGALALRVDGAALAPGVYVVTARAGAEVWSQRLVRR